MKSYKHKLQRFDYMVGDTVGYNGNMYKGSKKMVSGNGFVYIDYIEETQNIGGRLYLVKNRDFCKTHFSYPFGSGKKRFDKSTLHSVRLLLTEKNISEEMLSECYEKYHPDNWMKLCRFYYKNK